MQNYTINVNIKIHAITANIGTLISATVDPFFK